MIVIYATKLYDPLMNIIKYWDYVHHPFLRFLRHFQISLKSPTTLLLLEEVLLIQLYLNFRDIDNDSTMDPFPIKSSILVSSSIRKLIQFSKPSLSII